MATRTRQKTEKIAQNRDKRARAEAKYIRISPTEAVAILKNTPNIACEYILKVVESAGANAENNLGLNKNDLVVAETFANGGPTLKRFQPVSKGRAHSINKRTSHITVILDVEAK